MKTKSPGGFPLLATISFLFPVALAGCTTNHHVGGGYYLKTGPPGLWEPNPGWHKLYFGKPGGLPHQVWGYVGGPVHTKDDLVVFIGDTQPGKAQHSDGLFAAHGGAPLLEIQKTVLALEAEKERADVSSTIDRYQICYSYLKPLTNGLEFQFMQKRGLNNPRLTISITWDELTEIMDCVLSQGSRQKDRSGKSYLQIRYPDSNEQEL